jgi:hypothetical protein
MNILQAMDDPRVFGKFFTGPSWDAWKVFLAALFALPMTPDQLAIYQKHTGRTRAPQAPAREAWVLTGRRAGKSLTAALITVYLSVFRDWSPYLMAGEAPTAMVVSPDRRQSRIIGRFQRGFCRAIPAIAQLLTTDTRESVELANGCVLETMTASTVTLRGYTSHVVVNDEISFFPQEDSVDPDREILVAERPCLASLPGSLLLNISSPYARRGAMWDAFQDHYGKDGDPVLFWKASSLEMNPSLDPAVVAAAYDLDPAVASAEWGGEFRSDCERLFTEEMLERVTDHDRPEILPYAEEDVA